MFEIIGILTTIYYIIGIVVFAIMFYRKQEFRNTLTEDLADLWSRSYVQPVLYLLVAVFMWPALLLRFTPD